MDYITAYARSGHTVLFSTHNLYVASEICTKAVIISGGRIAKILGPEEIRLGGRRLMEYWYHNDDDGEGR